jgi:hypothetical protein
VPRILRACKTIPRVQGVQQHTRTRKRTRLKTRALSRHSSQSKHPGNTDSSSLQGFIWPFVFTSYYTKHIKAPNLMNPPHLAVDQKHGRMMLHVFVHE